MDVNNIETTNAERNVDRLNSTHLVFGEFLELGIKAL